MQDPVALLIPSGESLRNRGGDGSKLNRSEWRIEPSFGKNRSYARIDATQSPVSLQVDENRKGPAAQDRERRLPPLPMRPPVPDRPPHNIQLSHMGHPSHITHRRQRRLYPARRPRLDQDWTRERRRLRWRGRMVRTYFWIPYLIFLTFAHTFPHILPSPKRYYTFLSHTFPHVSLPLTFLKRCYTFPLPHSSTCLLFCYPLVPK